MAQPVSMLKSIWKDPVWSKVIAAGILAVAGAVGTYLLDLWPPIARWMSSLWRMASEPSQVANWVLWLLGLLAVLGLVFVALVLWSTFGPQARSDERSWLSYLEDSFLGLRWRWNYISSGALKDPLPFCPHCDYQVFPHQASAYSAVDRIGFHCDSCGRDLPTFEETFESLQSKVARLVQQKIRTGGWKSDVI